MKRIKLQKTRRSAFTLVESLVASAILMIGISAASSLSLAMMTQEEINRRTAEAANIHENAVTMYQMGLDSGEIQTLLPNSQTIKNLTFTTGTHVIDSTAGSISYADIALEFFTTPSTGTYTAGSYIAGESDKTRTTTVRAYRAEL